MTSFVSVSTSAARFQDISLNPQKLAGQCAKLKCCLNYEVDCYVEAQKRLPSRELGILVSSLVVGARSGGGLVTALRDIAETLDTRKEVRREIKTLYTQTIATAYAVLGVSGLAVFLLEGLNPGTVDEMIVSPIGQVAIVFAVAVYSGVIWAVRKMTRVDI